MLTGQDTPRRLRLLARPSVFITLLICVMLTACGGDICGTEIPNSPPDKPFNPFPPDSGVASIDTPLDWECTDPEGDPLTFDVYFGTETTPLIESENEAKSIYKPDSLEYETRYYWQIVAKDREGNIASGRVWTFTTVSQENVPPDPPSIVSPAHNEENVAVDDSLVWQSSDPNLDPLTHDVVLDTNFPPTDTVARDMPETSYDPPGDLEYNKRYYWQIVVKDTAGHVTAGDVWEFTTVENQSPSVSNLDPTNFAIDLNPLNITLNWEASDPEGDPLTYDVLVDTLIPPVQTLASDITAATFTPVGLDYGKKYYWRIRAKDGFNEKLGDMWEFNTRAPVELDVLCSYNTGSAQGVAISREYESRVVVYVANHDSGLVCIDAVIDPGGSCDLNVVGSYNAGGGLDVATQGEYGYMAAGDAGFQVYSSPWLLDFQDSVHTSGKAEGVAVDGDYAYVADGFAGLCIVDVSVPNNISIVGTCDTPGYARHVDISEDYAFVADENEGLQVINVSDRRQPTGVGSYQAWNAADVFVSGDLAYVAANEFFVIDISNPDDPQERGKLGGLDYATAVTVVDSYAYVVHAYGDVRVIDISDPEHPKLAGYCRTELASAYDVAVDGDYIYVARGIVGLQVMDKSPLD